jgi:hypothetical protein
MPRMTHILVAATFLAAATAAMAVTNGRPDNGDHPYVGVMIQPIPGTNLASFCTGAAISPTKFLTAAHCADPALPVLVSFKSGPPFGGTLHTGTFHPHPDWCIGCNPGLPGFDTHDVAVVVFDVALSPSAPVAVLPTPHLVDTLAMKASVDIVGYGVQGFLHGGGPPTEIFTATRYYAPSQLIQSNNVQSDEFIKLTANPAQGKGGICFGDSGGSDFLGGTNIILAVNSYVTNGNCTGVTYSQRIDLPEILQFIFDTN